MTRQDVEQLLARRDEALAHRDAVGLGLLYAEDAILESPTAGGMVRGRAAIETVTHAWFNGFPDVVFTTETLIIDGDRAVWIGRTHGTDTGGFMGLDATNKPFELPMVFVCTLRDGLIVHERRIYDFTGMLVQIGVLKAKFA
jgi:ketosteroid isomerase-like protein